MATTEPESPEPWRNSKVLTSVLSGILLLLGWLAGMTGAPQIAPVLIYILAILVGGYFFGREAIEELFFEREIGIELLMSVAAVAAAVMGQAGEGAMLVFLYSISEALEGYTEQKTRSAIRALMDLAPRKATVKCDDGEFEIPVEEIEVDDIFIVKPGKAIATDGEVISGRSSVNQAPVTGESVPVEKDTGDTVFAASINEKGTLEVRATKTFRDNTLARIIELVQQAQNRKGRGQRFIERFGARYSPAVLVIGILLSVLPPLVTQTDWAASITRAMVFIVAAAPCALVISIPITMVAALGTAARRGVLVKGGVFLEDLAKIEVVALDKTGTLTRGEPEVTDILACDNGSDVPPHSSNDILMAAASIEQRSEHPLADAILQYAQAQGITLREPHGFESLTGAGACAQINGEKVYVGNPSLFEQRLGVCLRTLRGDIARWQTQGKTVVVVGDERTSWGLIAIRDTLRPNARTAIEALHALGIHRIVMLTGDNELAAQTIASEAGIDEFYANLKPEDKVSKVRDLTGSYGHVAMVGDGVNDAPALAEATVGVAMGAAGTDVALETADVALMADDLEKLTYALKLAHRNRTVVRQNLWMSATVIGGLILGALSGEFSLPVAVLGHEISELVVIASGLRMLRS